jgi:hypothetical protein
LEGTLQRLAEAKIEIVPADLAQYFVLSRDGFACLVEKTKTSPIGFGAVGSICKLTGQGFAVVTWDGTQAYFTTKSGRQPATPEELRLLRSFKDDLKSALTA